MPTLPDKTALGPLEVRPAVPGIAVPANPVGEALTHLGAQVARAGATMAAADRQADDFDAQRRLIEFQDQQSETFAEKMRNAAPGAPNFGEQARADFRTAGDEFYQTIPEAIRPKYAIKLRSFEAGVAARAREFEYKAADQAIGGLIDDSAERLVNRVGTAQTRDDVYTNHQAALEDAGSLTDAAPLTPIQREVASRNIRGKLTAAAATRLAEVDPAHAIEALGGFTRPGQTPAPGSDQAALVDTAGRLGIAPRDLAAAISYETGGKFDPNIAGGEGGAYRGLIQFGPEEQKKYGIRPGMTIAEQMPAVEAYLKDRGLKPGAGISEIYRTINGGYPGASLNASDGNGTIREHIARIGAGHYDSADRFLGGAGGIQGDPRFASLPLPERQKALRLADANLRKAETAGLAGFKTRVQDSEAEAARTGAASNPVSEDEFKARLGPDAGAAAHAQYTANLQTSADIQTVAAMSPEEQDALLKRYEPQPGEGYAIAAKRQDDLAKAIAQARQARAKDPEFKARIDNTIAEAARNGTASKPIGEEEFVHRFGKDAGAGAYADYSASLRLGRDAQQAGELSPREQQALLTNAEPVPGSDDFAITSKRHKALSDAIRAANEQKGADPAAFAIARLPASREAYAAFTKAASDPTMSAAGRAAAARNFATATLIEQARVGVPPDQQRVVPQDYVDRLVTTLEHPDTLKRSDGKSGTPLDAARVIEQESKLWGDAWPLVARDVQGKATIPIVRVLAAGVSDQAAMALPSLIGSSLNDILKGHGEESIKTLKHDVDGAMKKFAGSMLGTREQTSFFNDYVVSGEKLAAYYVLNGKQSGEAAELAFKHLLGFKYDFVEGGLFGAWGSRFGTVRVPKDSGIPVDRITRGAEEARTRLDWLEVAPAVASERSGLSADSFGLLTKSGLARDAVWATAPGDVGLMLVHNGKVVERRDGEPLVLTWRDLSGFADQADKRLESFRLGPLPRG